MGSVYHCDPSRELCHRHNREEPELPLINYSLKGLINLKSLVFGIHFNQPLDDSLKGLTNLKSLVFGIYFNQPLGDSLKYLPNLKTFNGQPYP
jgi:hypothetical protein